MVRWMGGTIVTTSDDCKYEAIASVVVILHHSIDLLLKHIPLDQERRGDGLILVHVADIARLTEMMMVFDDFLDERREKNK